VNRQDAIALILSIVDGARPPVGPIDSELPQSVPKQSAARKRGAESSSSSSVVADEVSSTKVSAQKKSTSKKNSAASPVSPINDEEKLRQTLTECALLDKSDTDNGKRLIAHFGTDLIVRAEREVATGTWLHWCGTHWDIDGGAAEVAKLAQKVGDLIIREADFIEQTDHEREAIAAGKKAAEQLRGLAEVPEAEWDSERRRAAIALEAIIEAGKRAYGRWTTRKQKRRDQGVAAKNSGKIKAMLDCAGPHLRRPPEEFNVDGYKVATLKHTLRFVRTLSPDTTEVERWDADLEVIEGHAREDYITACVPVVYDPAAKIGRFKDFIERFLPDPDVRRTVQQFCGLSLLNIPTQFFMIHHGTGANGKSVFLETLFRLFGPSFAVGLPQESIAGSGQRGAGQAQPDIALLHGKHFLRVTELKEGVPLQEDVIKRLTGGEAITARTMYAGYFDFVPLAKPHFSCNGFPKIDGGSAAVFRRALIVEWPVVLKPEEQRDFDVVVGELVEDAPGILNWLIEGALQYLREGLYVASGVRAATQAYRDEMDTVGVFRRACVHEKPGGTIKAREMYRAYLAWCEANAKNPVKETRFGREMKKLVKRDDTGAVHAYVDVELHDVPPSDQSSPNERSLQATTLRGADEIAF
jgi:putative DNA primase/helicase